MLNYCGHVDIVLGPSLESFRSVLQRELLISTGAVASARIFVSLGPAWMRGHCPTFTFGNVGWSDDSASGFLCSDGKGHFCEVDFGSLSVDPALEIELRVCCAGFSPNVLLEWLVIPIALFPLAAHGLAPVHASGVVLPGSRGGLVFTAWSGVGKTNLLLAALRSWPELRYLGDDIVIVGTAGTALPSSRSISAYGYNRRLLSGLGLRDAARMRACGEVRRAVLKRRSKMGRGGDAIIYLANALSRLRVENDRAQNPADATAHAVSHHVRCVAGAANGTFALTAGRSSVPASEAGAHLAVLDYEYVTFRRYLDASRWAGTHGTDPWAALRAEWQSILSKHFERVPDRLDLVLPQSTDPAAEMPLVWQELHRAVTV